MTYTEKRLKFEELPAVNYNLYIGSGEDACDNCLKYEDAVNQILDFFHQGEQEMLETVEEELYLKGEYPNGIADGLWVSWGDVKNTLSSLDINR